MTWTRSGETWIFFFLPTLIIVPKLHSLHCEQTEALILCGWQRLLFFLTKTRYFVPTSAICEHFTLSRKENLRLEIYIFYILFFKFYCLSFVIPLPEFKGCHLSQHASQRAAGGGWAPAGPGD